MSIAENRLAAVLHDLEELPPDQISQLIAQLLQPSQADFAQALGVFVQAALTAGAEVERLSGEPLDVRGETDRLLLDQRIKAEAHRIILNQEFLDSSAVGVALGMTGVNKREAASDLRRAGALLGVPERRNKFLYPRFQIDMEHERVHPVVAEVNRLLAAKDDPWGAASWWISDNPRLGGVRPQDLVGTVDEEKLVAAATGGDD
jgi:hypothetical protein